MRKLFSIILISLFIFAVFTPVLAQNNNEDVNITINSLKGTVYRKTDQGFFNFFKTVVWMRLLDNSNMKTGETIKTDSDSMLSLNIGKFNRVEITSESILNIAEDTKPLKQKLGLEKGVVWINTTLETNDEFNLKIDTPTCIINTGQSIFKLEISRDRTFLYMRSGRAVIKEKTTQAEKVITEDNLVVVEDKTIKLYDKISETGKDSSTQ